nr:sigma-70 family RNA polymerase sigma factor [Herminiimonas arsenitoxidans]
MITSRSVGELYIDHQGWLQTWLRRKLGCSDHAADLTQDTFVQLMSGMHPANLSEPRAYITVIAKRVLFNFWRRRDLENAYLEALAALPEDVAPSMEDRALVLEALEQIDRALAAIPVKAKQVFLLNQLQELTYSEIAAQLLMPVITVRRYMKLAICACCTAAE